MLIKINLKKFHNILSSDFMLQPLLNIAFLYPSSKLVPYYFHSPEGTSLYIYYLASGLCFQPCIQPQDVFQEFLSWNRLFYLFKITYFKFIFLRNLYTPIPFLILCLFLLNLEFSGQRSHFNSIKYYILDNAFLLYFPRIIPTANRDVFFSSDNCCFSVYSIRI